MLEEENEERTHVSKYFLIFARILVSRWKNLWATGGSYSSRPDLPARYNYEKDFPRTDINNSEIGSRNDTSQQ
ncbi:unnamed protein product, partial [Mesorhabditis belari]|uniref:Uncharacterized protein n=1 Tax=Mesorhabditis belari TaxID=2138241 RepID=A0AAF3FMQ4_9BILA